MAQIKYMDTDGDKSRVLPKGSFGMDDYPAGNDVGRVYIGTGSKNIPLAKKAEVDLVDTKLGAINVRVVNLESQDSISMAIALG